MTDLERENVSVTLCRLWPGKFRDEELVDLCDRLERYRPRDIVSALNDHKNSSKWRPQASEILARLKGKEQREPGEPTQHHDSLIDAVRKQRPELEGVPDTDVAMRYWRSQWFRYKGGADARRTAMVNAFVRNDVPKPTRQTLTRAHDRNAASARRRVICGCTGTLVQVGVSSKLANRYALACVKSDPETFRNVMADLRDFGRAGPVAA